MAEMDLDGSRFYIVGSGNDFVYAYNLSTPWDISSATYATESLDVNPPESSPFGVFFKPDGSQVYIGGNGTDDVHAFDLSTDWDVSSGSDASDALDSSPEDTVMAAFFIHPDGDKAYTLGNTNKKVFQYTLSTPYDLSTGTYASKSLDVSVSTNSMSGLFFSDDGTKLFTIDRGAFTVRQYTLSTPWDVSSGSYASKSFSISSETTQPWGMFFKPDGSRCYVCDRSSGIIYAYDLSTNWDASTGSYATELKDVSAQEGSPGGIFFGVAAAGAAFKPRAMVF